LFPNADHVSNGGIWLPSHFHITEEEVGRVADAIRAAVGNASARSASPTKRGHATQDASVPPSGSAKVVSQSR